MDGHWKFRGGEALPEGVRHYPRGWGTTRGGEALPEGVRHYPRGLKGQIFKGKYEDKLEFPEGWRGSKWKTICGGDIYGYFLEPHSLDPKHCTAVERKLVLSKCFAYLEIQYNNHKLSFNHCKHSHNTIPSRYIWDLKDYGTKYSIKWSTVKQASPYKGYPSHDAICVYQRNSVSWLLTDLHSSTRDNMQI